MKHEWTDRGSLGVKRPYTVCASCGIVQNEGNKNNECDGIPRVGPRNMPEIKPGPNGWLKEFLGRHTI